MIRRKAAYLIALGHDVHIVTFGDCAIPGATVHKLPYNRLTQVSRLRYVTVVPMIRRLIAEHKPDVIDALGTTSMGFTAALVGFSPLVVTVSGPDLLDNAERYAPLRWMTQHAVNSATAVYSSTPVVSEHLIKRYGLAQDRVFDHTFGIDVDMFDAVKADARQRVREELDIPMDAVILLNNRRIEKAGRYDLMVKTVVEMTRSRSDLYLVLVSPPSSVTGRKLKRELEHYVLDVGAADRVRFVSELSYDRMIETMIAADIYLCLHTFDLLSNSVLEAMLAGLVPVLSPQPAYQEVITHGKNGYFVDPMTSENLSTLLGDVIGRLDAIQTDVIPYNTKLIRSHYRWQDAMIWIGALYETLIERAQSDTF